MNKAIIYSKRGFRLEMEYKSGKGIQNGIRDKKKRLDKLN